MNASGSHAGYWNSRSIGRRASFLNTAQKIALDELTILVRRRLVVSRNPQVSVNEVKRQRFDPLRAVVQPHGLAARVVVCDLTSPRENLEHSLLDRKTVDALLSRFKWRQIKMAIRRVTWDKQLRATSEGGHEEKYRRS